MKKVKFIYNPMSGNKNIVNEIDKIISIYQQAGYILEPYRIEKNININFENELEGYSHILVSGGDGTINSVVNKIKKSNIDIPIGILPSGTANDFAKALGIEGTTENIVKNILNDKPSNIDLGKINDSFFINVASIGMFTDVSQKIDTSFKNNLGKIAYYIKGLEEAINLRSFNICVKSKELSYEGEIYLMLIFNGNSAGNINLAYNSKLDDGFLDVIIFKAIPIKRSINLLIQIIKQQHLESNSEIIYFRTKKLEVISKELMTIDVDGEAGPHTPAIIECMSNNMKVLVK